MSERRADIHLVCGATGAGKSTYSDELAQSINGMRFSIDEWMQRLHSADKPDELLCEWFYERVQRNCAQMRDVPIGIRWQRVQKRNVEQAETFQFEVTRDMFDFIESMWEAPDDVEMTRLNGKRITD